MDLLDLLKLMFRRWYVSAPVVVVTLGAALAFGAAIQPEYKSELAILLVPPTTSTAAPAPNATPRPGNPWLRIGESAMAQAVQISMSAHDARTKVAAAGGDPDYEVGLVTRSSILTVAVTAPSESSALATVTAVTKLINDEVAGQQAQYKPNPGEQITTEVLDPGLNIVQSRSNVLRAQIVIAAIGALLAAVAAVVHDALARRRAAARFRQQRDARTPMTWNAGQAVGNAPRPGAGSAGPPAPGVTPAPSMRPAPAAGPATATGRDATQPIASGGSGRAGDRAAGHGTKDRTGSHAATERPAGDRATGPQVRAEYRSAPQSDETILLTAVRNPADDSTP